MCTLQKYHTCATAEQRPRDLEQPGQRREGPGDHMPGRDVRQILDPGVVDRDRQPEIGRRGAQKSAFSALAFDQFDPLNAEHGQN